MPMKLPLKMFLQYFRLQYVPELAPTILPMNLPLKRLLQYFTLHTVYGCVTTVETEGHNRLTHKCSGAPHIVEGVGTNEW